MEDGPFFFSTQSPPDVYVEALPALPPRQGGLRFILGCYYCCREYPKSTNLLLIFITGHTCITYNRAYASIGVFDVYFTPSPLGAPFRRRRLARD